MKIKSVGLDNFKRFRKLTVENIPEQAKLVLLIGPNGCGKSSLLDAIYGKCQYMGRRIIHSKGGSYYSRDASVPDDSKIWDDKVKLEFHDRNPETQEAWKKSVYARSAHRNVPEFSVRQISSVGSALEETSINRMIDNDQSIQNNYMRLIANSLQDIFAKYSENMTLKEFRKKHIGDINKAVKNLFPSLSLQELGNFLDGNKTSFVFDKNGAKGFDYKNLSGGEKAAFDLLLDIVVKAREYDDTVYCIDEPEAHINTKIQSELLTVIYGLIPDNCQLWIATHSIGMMRRAYDIQKEFPEEVAFLIFDDNEMDFDDDQTITPQTIDRPLWEKMHTVLLDDFAKLIMPDTIIICESETEKSFDAGCYEKIFSHEYPAVKFISAGSKANVVKVATMLSKAFNNVIALRDRDKITDEERGVKLRNDSKLRILKRCCIEDYLLDDEVLKALCLKNNFGDDVLDQLKSIRERSASGKQAAGEIRTILERKGVEGTGDNRDGFLEYSLAPLINTQMRVYKELRQCIFPSSE